MMSRFIKKTSVSKGLVPGTMVHIGESRTEPVKITLIDYDPESFRESEFQRVEDCFPFKTTPTVTWINIDGLHQLDIIEKLGKNFDLHPLILEDIVNTGQRPKLEDFENYLFVVIKMLSCNNGRGEIDSEQVSFVLGKDFVISFQERVGDVFDSVRNRIRTGKGRVRRQGADYLLYSCLDAVVDNYFVILEKIGDQIEHLEEELVTDADTQTLHRIHGLKREMLFLRKSVWPLRELVSGLLRGENALIQPQTAIYLRDVYDHAVQVIDTIETFRDILAGMLDMYLSSISNKMNEVMKVLTMIATIFIPITFVAGIYGMNFNPESSPWNMPELNWRYGYLSFWVVVLLIAGGMVTYFKKKRWF